MNAKNTSIKKIASVPVLAVTLLTVLSALILIFSVFSLPMVKVLGESLTMKQIDELPGGEGTYSFLLISCAISLIWAIIPTKWASIVGMIYGIFPIILCVGQTIDWSSQRYITVQSGSIMMSVFSVAVFLLSIAKLVVLIMNKKQAKTPAPVVMLQPPYTTV